MCRLLVTVILGADLRLQERGPALQPWEGGCVLQAPLGLEEGDWETVQMEEIPMHLHAREQREQTLKSQWGQLRPPGHTPAPHLPRTKSPHLKGPVPG